MTPWRFIGLVLLPALPLIRAVALLVGTVYSLYRVARKGEGMAGVWEIVRVNWYAEDQSANAAFKGNPDRTISHRVAVAVRDKGRANRFMYYLHRVLERVHPSGHANFGAIEYDD